MAKPAILGAATDEDLGATDVACHGVVACDFAPVGDDNSRAGKGDTEHSSMIDGKKALLYEQSIEDAKVIGSGTFGTVFKAVLNSGETIAVKKVLQDPSFKDRELELLVALNKHHRHRHLIELKHYFYRGEEGKRQQELYLYIVMGFMPWDLSHLIGHYMRKKRTAPQAYTKLYMYQLARGLMFLHSRNVCHRDLKPQNVLFDPATNLIQICDLGSAKILEKGQPSVAYIASRYYRAPELIFESRYYSTSIDIWAFGCVLAEMLLGEPLFRGESTLDQCMEIICALGTPTASDLRAMCPEEGSLSGKIKKVDPVNFAQVFGEYTPSSAVKSLEQILVYKPGKRPPAVEILKMPFFDDLRSSTSQFPSNVVIPTLFDFVPAEYSPKDAPMIAKLIPPHVRNAAETSPFNGKPSGLFSQFIPKTKAVAG